jgi:hypothetical protein
MTIIYFHAQSKDILKMYNANLTITISRVELYKPKFARKAELYNYVYVSNRKFCLFKAMSLVYWRTLSHRRPMIYIK